jgi:hypothetical protein
MGALVLPVQRLPHVDQKSGVVESMRTTCLASVPST